MSLEVGGDGLAVRWEPLINFAEQSGHESIPFSLKTVVKRPSTSRVILLVVHVGWKVGPAVGILHFVQTPVFCFLAFLILKHWQLVSFAWREIERGAPRRPVGSFGNI